MDKTLYLEAAREGEILKIGIRERKTSDLDPCIDPYEVKELTLDKLAQIEALCLKTMDFLGSTGGRNDINKRADESLKKMGEMLSDELLTPKVKEAILKSDATFLIIRIEDSMVQVPWELICLNDRFLCERFDVGRLVRTRQEISLVKDKQVAYPINMWLLANPGKDLPNADEEGSLILQITDSVNPDDATVVNASLDSANMTPEKISSKIKNSDIVHFAGHAEYNSEEIEKSGWKIAGEYFSPKDIDKMAGSSKMPVIIFSNACQSARTDEWKDEKNSFGIANAFLRAGVKYYVGTAWEIMDTPSTLFACEFYNQLFSGKSIGESVRMARSEIKKQYSNDYLGWAGYLLYGDPRYKIYEAANDTSTAIRNDNQTALKIQPRVMDGIRGTITEKGVLPFSTEKKNVSTGYVFSLLFAVLIVCGGILGYRMFLKQHDLEETRFQREMVVQETERKDALIENISKHMDTAETSPKTAEKVSDAVTAAVVYDAFSPQSGIIASKIKTALKEKNPEITFLERQELNTLLEEVNLALALPAEKKLKLNMLPADYIIKLTNVPSAAGTDMDIKVLSTRNGENLIQERLKIREFRNIPEEMINRFIVTMNNDRGGYGTQN